MNKFLIILIAGLLTSCVSYNNQLHYSATDKIQTLVLNKESNIIYAIGTQYDYEIRPCVSEMSLTKSSNSLPDQQCLKTFKLLTSAELAPFIRNLDIRMNITIGPREYGLGHYTVAFADNEESKVLFSHGEDYRTQPIRTFTLLNRVKSEDNEHEKIAYSHIYFNARIVKLQEKEEILSKGQLRNPLYVDTQVYTSKRSHEIMPIFKAPLVVIGVAAGTVLLVPYLMFGQICESTKKC